MTQVLLPHHKCFINSALHYKWFENVIYETNAFEKTDLFHTDHFSNAVSRNNHCLYLESYELHKKCRSVDC